MEQLLIREANSSDIDTLLRFEQGVIAAEQPFDPTLKREPTRYYDIPFMIDATHVHLVVAEINNTIVGSGYARIEDAKPYLNHSQKAYLGFMYVEEPFRGKGVNKKILEALKEWSAAKGIREMRLDVYFLNEPAIHAYEKAGFIKHMIEMRSPL